MNILYIAFSCSPNNGSEDSVGWNVPLVASKKHNVFVVTKEEARESVNHWFKMNDNPNLHFYYVDIPNIFKKIFDGFLFSGRLNVYHRKALPLVKKICKEKHIDIIHQITPVEFRAIGNYGTIDRVRFICGPIGGGRICA